MTAAQHTQSHLEICRPLSGIRQAALEALAALPMKGIKGLVQWHTAEDLRSTIVSPHEMQAVFEIAGIVLTESNSNSDVYKLELDGLVRETLQATEYDCELTDVPVWPIWITRSSRERSAGPPALSVVANNALLQRQRVLLCDAIARHYNVPSDAHPWYERFTPHAEIVRARVEDLKRIRQQIVIGRNLSRYVTLGYTTVKEVSV